jgi:hypothetical protein
MIGLELHSDYVKMCQNIKAMHELGELKTEVPLKTLAINKTRVSHSN